MRAENLHKKRGSKRKTPALLMEQILNKEGIKEGWKTQKKANIKHPAVMLQRPKMFKQQLACRTEQVLQKSLQALLKANHLSGFHAHKQASSPIACRLSSHVYRSALLSAPLHQNASIVTKKDILGWGISMKMKISTELWRQKALPWSPLGERRKLHCGITCLGYVN